MITTELIPIREQLERIEKKIDGNFKNQYLSIISRGKSVNVGNFLSLKELSELAKTIKSALIKRENHLTFDM